MIRINLYPEYRAKRIQERADVLNQLAIAVGSIALVLILCVVVAIFQSQQLQKVQDEKAQKEARLEALKKEIGVVDNFEKKKKDLDEKRNSINQLRENQEGPVIVMDDISRSMSEAQVWLTDMSINGSNTILAGFALTNEDIVDFQTILQATPSFSVVNLVVSEKSGTANEPLYTFKLSLDG